MKKNTEYLATAGVIAAAYTALTVLLQPISYGAVQLRVSELLTVLPVYFPAAIPGLTVGCFLSNLIGLAGNPAGAWDLLCGTGATALAAISTYALRRFRIGKLPVLATLPPVLFNALIVGTELYVLYGGFPLWMHILWVGIGQLGACVVGGLLLAAVLQKSKLVKRV